MGWSWIISAVEYVQEDGTVFAMVHDKLACKLHMLIQTRADIRLKLELIEFRYSTWGIFNLLRVNGLGLFIELLFYISKTI